MNECVCIRQRARENEGKTHRPLPFPFVFFAPGRGDTDVKWRDGGRAWTGLDSVGLSKVGNGGTGWVAGTVGELGKVGE